MSEIVVKAPDTCTVTIAIEATFVNSKLYKEFAGYIMVNISDVPVDMTEDVIDMVRVQAKMEFVNALNSGNNKWISVYPHLEDTYPDLLKLEDYDRISIHCISIVDSRENV